MIEVAAELDLQPMTSASDVVSWVTGRLTAVAEAWAEMTTGEEATEGVLLEADLRLVMAAVTGVTAAVEMMAVPKSLERAYASFVESGAI